MATAWKSAFKLCKVFNPARTDLITSPEVYQNLVRRHNAYIDLVTAAAVKGLHPYMLDKEIAIDDEKVFVQEYLIWKNSTIESMDRTNLSSDKGC
eukprot:5605351-Ditylum_brightwellii.AAC.1